MGVKIVSYKDKEIFYLDYRGMDEDQMIDTVKQGAEKMVEAGKKGQKLLNFSNVEGVVFGLKFVNAAKAATKPCEPYVAKAAVTGMKGLKETMLKIYNRAFEAEGIRLFDTEQEALDWLVK